MDMSSHKPPTKVVSNKSARRLKDSCDMCSASKVRCNRQKPICSRCEKLEYPCFYSPARRVGRPHGRRSGPVPVPPLPTPNKSARTEQYSSRPSHGPSRPGVHRLWPWPRTPPGRELNITGNIEGQRLPVDVRGGLHAQHGSTYVGTYNHNLNSRVDSSSTGSSPIPEASRHLYTTCERRPRLPSTDATSKPTAPDTCEPDCAVIAMEMQQQLEAAYEGLHLSPSGGGGPELDAESADASLDTVGAVLRHLSTILICPCSERLEVGLLIAAACISVLDVHSAIVVRSGARRPSSRGLEPAAAPEESAAQLWDAISLSAGGDGGGKPEEEKGAVLVRVLEELTKMATVVCQFIKRYRGGGGEANFEGILHAVAAYLKERLQVVRDDTARRLL